LTKAYVEERRQEARGHSTGEKGGVSFGGGGLCFLSSMPVAMKIEHPGFEAGKNA